MVPLAPKALDVLAALLDRRGEAVPKEDLLRAVWPDCAVEEIGLARNISILRKALGPDGEAFIETIPKRGYRFLLESTADTPSPGRAWRYYRWPVILMAIAEFLYWQFYRPSGYLAGNAAAASLAVAPFDVVGGGGEVAGAFHDSAVAELSRQGRAQLISPSTVRRYRILHIPLALMCRVLGVDAVVEAPSGPSGHRSRSTSGSRTSTPAG